MKKKLNILGCRGIPAAHGGFETFAEHLALFLSTHGYDVSVYCQEEGSGTIYEDSWQGVRLVRIPVSGSGPKATIVFDYKCALHAARSGSTVLTLGYNTAIFSLIYRIKGIRNLMNMDGIEWKREKWSRGQRAWLHMNERFGSWFSNHLFADNPEIKKHLAESTKAAKITMIPYGADLVESADSALIEKMGLQANGYCLLIARPEPENSILEIVRAFSASKRGIKLVALGAYDPSEKTFHKEVFEAASSEVVFPGAIYDKTTVSALRFFSRLYLHGHRVGGTNPSLVESLGAGNAVIAHDNPFNRWVVADGARYFDGEDELTLLLDEIIDNRSELEKMERASLSRFKKEFTWKKVLGAYEAELDKWV